jgi:hypothetical protein
MNIVPENRHLLVHPVEEEATVDNTVQLLLLDSETHYLVLENYVFGRLQ